jgi:cytochrome o ubiquinol oxidase subunit 3
MTDFTIHHTEDPKAVTSWPDPHQERYSKTYLGFWIYLMTDCLLFASLFVTYAVLKNRVFGGPTTAELFDLRLAFAETMILLFSSVTCGLATLATMRRNPHRAIGWLGVTFLLGSAFFALELWEFQHLVNAGHSWRESAFLSSFFALVGMHGLHIAAGLFWLVVMVAQLWTQGVTTDVFRRLVLFGLFWHFLDLVWIFIYTLVYLMGVI